MKPIHRREFLAIGAAIGAGVAWGAPLPRVSLAGWRERRDLYRPRVTAKPKH